jgi:hypothetical protein
MMFYDSRNFQFATILTELSNHQMTPKMKDELEIVKLTVMNIGRENSLKQGDDPSFFTENMGALSLLMMAAQWMIQTDLLTLDGGE